jgi:hypothetical protein
LAALFLPFIINESGLDAVPLLYNICNNTG